MIHYIESFHIFKEANRRRKFPLSAAKVEMELVSQLKDLHHGYLHDKVKYGISYSLSSQLLMITYNGNVNNHDEALMHYNIAYVIINHLMERHRKDVELHFQNSHPDNSDYCALLKSTIFKEMVDDKKCKEEIEYKRPAPYTFVHVYDDEKPHSSFGCTLTKTQKEALVYFINQSNINFHKITLQDIESFLECKEGFFIRPHVNRKAVLILTALHANGFINGNWQYLVATHHLLKSSSGKKFLEQRDLSSPKHIINKKGSKELDPTEKRIIEFIGQLKKL